MFVWKYLTVFLALAKTGILGAAIKPFGHRNKRSQVASLLTNYWPERKYELDTGLPTADSFHSHRHGRKLRKEREDLLSALLKTFTSPDYLEEDGDLAPFDVEINKHHSHNFRNNNGESQLRRVRKHLTTDGPERVTRSYEPCLSGVGGGNRLCEFEQARDRTVQHMGMRKLYEFLARWNERND